MPRKSAKTVEKVEERDPVLYELGYLLVPSIAQAQLEKEVEKIKDILGKKNAEVIGGENPEMEDLAYTMSKSLESSHKDYTTAYFGWLHFRVTPEAVEGIEADLRANDSLIRYLILKKDEELLNPSTKSKVDTAIEELVNE